MGLFDKKDKKRKDDFDSPVEQIDLSSVPTSAPAAATRPPEPTPAARSPEPAPGCV